MTTSFGIPEEWIADYEPGKEVEPPPTLLIFSDGKQASLENEAKMIVAAIDNHTKDLDDLDNRRIGLIEELERIIAILEN